MLPILRSMLPALDPPEHMQLRRKLFPPLKATAVARFAEGIAADCRALLKGAAGRGEIDFVAQVAAEVPMRAFGALMGLGPADLEPMRTCTDAVISQGANNSAASILSLFEQLDRLVAARRKHPGDDYLSVLAAVETTDEPMASITRNGMLLQIIIGGLETTRNTITGTLLALRDNPAQLDLMRSRPDLLGPAMEEALRYISPVNYLRRTTTAAVDIGATPLPAGARVVVFLTAANRDPQQFQAPHRFDITRAGAAAHIAFGAGEHFCMGAALARLELASFWAAFMQTIAAFQISGKETRVPSVQQNAIERLPVALHL
jgi:cytochrome P450